MSIASILTFLMTYWDSILVVIAFIILVAVLIKRGEIKILKQILFNLVTQAEQTYGDGTGKLKYAVVADWLYQRIPTVLKFLFTAKDIENLIEDVLEEAKAAWSTNDKLLTAGTITATAETIMIPADAEITKVGEVVQVSAPTENTSEKDISADGFYVE